MARYPVTQLVAEKFMRAPDHTEKPAYGSCERGGHGDGGVEMSRSPRLEFVQQRSLLLELAGGLRFAEEFLVLAM